MLTEVAVSVVFTHQSLALHAGVGGWEAGMQLAVVYNTQATQFKINRPGLGVNINNVADFGRWHGMANIHDSHIFRGRGVGEQSLGWR